MTRAPNRLLRPGVTRFQSRCPRPEAQALATKQLKLKPTTAGYACSYLPGTWQNMSFWRKSHMQIAMVCCLIMLDLDAGDILSGPWSPCFKLHFWWDMSKSKGDVALWVQWKIHCFPNNLESTIPTIFATIHRDIYQLFPKIHRHPSGCRAHGHQRSLGQCRRGPAMLATPGLKSKNGLEKHVLSLCISGGI